MTTFLMILTSIALLMFISFTVFSSGQIFMPIFRWFWGLLNRVFDAGIDVQEINNIFTISNITPGIFSTKLAFTTGFFITKGHWGGFALGFLTYFVFILIPILIMHGALKFMKKKGETNFMVSLMKVMNPVVSGIIAALVAQLSIAIIFPQIVFNESIQRYALIDETRRKALFFSGARRILLYIYMPVTIILSAVLYNTKVSIGKMFILNIIVCAAIFAPWYIPA